MKKFLVTLLSIICIIGCLWLSACADNGKGGGTQTTEEEVGQPSESEPNVEENIMYIKIGNTTLTATLADNSATDALVERLKTNPVTIEMSDYGGWEKVGGLGFSLPTSNEQITAQPCEFVLYQGNQLVIFYGSNSWSYTRLGKLESVTPSELKEILGTDDVTVTLSFEK